MAARSWSKVATPTTRPWSSTPIARPAGRQHGRVERGAQRVGADRERVAEPSAAAPAERVSPASPASRSAPTQPRGVPDSRADDEDPGLAGLQGLATVASAGSTGPVASASPAVRKNDSRLMPRSNPTNPAT